MNKRIKEIRNDLKLTQEEFGKKIGSARNTIANYEMGNRKPSNAIITSICRTFNVSEEWLREGVGEKYIGKDATFSEILSDLEDTDDDFIKNFISIYVELDESSKDALRKIAKRMAEKYKE